MRRAWLWLIVLAVVGTAATLLEPVQDALIEAVTWCASSGLPGVVVYGAIYCLSTILVFPAAALTAAAGWAWGVVWGTVIVLAVSLVADWIPFALARRAGRANVAAAAERARTLAALDAAMRQHGFLVVALLRLSPIAPYNVMNYLLGLTPVSVPTYLAASTLGCLPSCVLFAYGGSLVPRAEGLRDVRLTDDPWLLWGGILAALLAFVVITLLARRALRRYVAPASQPYEPAA